MADSSHGAQAPMEPLAVTLRYRDAAGDAHTVEFDVLAPPKDGVLGIDVSYDGEVIEASVTPAEAVTVDFFQVKLRHAFVTDEMVLLNGYQSWTDTIERPAWSRMKGLRFVPNKIVERWTLDGGGDYAFVDYSAKRGDQHGFTYGTFRRGESMVLVGSLDESHGFTLIRSHAGEGEVLLETECPLRELAAGKRVELGRYAITRGTEDQCYDRYFELMGVTARPIKPLVGYTSWYRHYGGITEEKLMEDLLDMDGRDAPIVPTISKWAERLFQIDDGYCKVGDWFNVNKRDFPQGLAPLTARIRERGFTPGLWLAPFVCEKDSKLFEERRDWLLRDDEGNLVPTGCHWSTGYALDTLNIEVRSYVLDALQTMTQEWGFELLKVDFLYAACMVPHGGMNRGELMADAMRLLRKGVEDSDALLLGCGVPLGSAFGVVDYCRIGCDVDPTWDDLPFMRPLHRERVSTKNSLRNTYGRAPLDGRAFGNDPDVFFLREDVKLSEAQRDALLFANADLGSALLTSDDKGLWTRRMRQRYNEAVRVLCERFSPGSLEELNEALPMYGVEDWQ